MFNSYSAVVRIGICVDGRPIKYPPGVHIAPCIRIHIIYIGTTRRKSWLISPKSLLGLMFQTFYRFNRRIIYTHTRLAAFQNINNCFILLRPEYHPKLVSAHIVLTITRLRVFNPARTKGVRARVMRKQKPDERKRRFASTGNSGFRVKLIISSPRTT